MAIESKMKGPIGRSVESSSSRKTGGWSWLLIVIVLIAGGWWLYSTQSGGGSSALEVSEDEYQAVFLDNGQVYFGQLDTSNDRFYTLTDVFYLQSGTVAVEQGSNLALTKLGNEAHGPHDEMHINIDHILFIEDMKDSSKVVEAIYSYKSSN